VIRRVGWFCDHGVTTVATSQREQPRADACNLVDNYGCNVEEEQTWAEWLLISVERFLVLASLAPLALISVAVLMGLGLIDGRFGEYEVDSAWVPAAYGVGLFIALNIVAVLAGLLLPRLQFIETTPRHVRKRMREAARLSPAEKERADAERVRAERERRERRRANDAKMKEIWAERDLRRAEAAEE